MDGFRSDLGRLDKHASEFEDLAGQAQRIADALRQAVDAAGRCWGGDEIGASFARTHCADADQVLNDVGELAARLRGIGVKFAETAVTTRQVDAGNAEELGRIAGQG